MCDYRSLYFLLSQKDLTRRFNHRLEAFYEQFNILPNCQYFMYTQQFDVVKRRMNLNFLKNNNLYSKRLCSFKRVYTYKTGLSRLPCYIPLTFVVCCLLIHYWSGDLYAINIDGYIIIHVIPT